MFPLIYFIFSLILLIYVLIKQRMNYWNDRGFLQPEYKLSLGSFTGIKKGKTPFESLDEEYKIFKEKTKALGIYAFLMPNLMLIDPELIKNVLMKDFNYFHDRGMYHNKEVDPTSANLLTLDGHEWRDRRTKLSPIFTSGKIKMMFEIVNEISDKFAEVLGKNLKITDVHEMKRWSQKFTADNIGNVAFGLECNCIEDDNSTFMKHGRRLLDLSPIEIIKFMFTLNLPKLGRFLKLGSNPKEAGDFFHNTFLQAFEYRQINKVNRNDFVSLLLGLKSLYTPSELAAEAFLVFAAGYETSSTLMTFTLYELALNQEIQDRLREEITAGIEENDGKLTYDMLFGFKYLDMVINEALRKYPPIPVLFRKCVKDYEIPNTQLVIPKDTKAMINIYSLHHDSEYYPQPSKFDPERFSDENIKNIKPFTFLPFGEGQRNCIGMRFGQMQSKIAILKLIKNFRFSSSERTPIPMKFEPFAPFLSPQGGMWLKIENI